MPDDPERDAETQTAGPKRHNVSRPIALDAVLATSLPVFLYNGVCIEGKAVKQVEDIARYDGRQSHESPVLTQSVNAKRLSRNRREYAKQEAVAQTTEARDETKQVRVDDTERTYLSHGENCRSNYETPDTACSQHLDEEV
jgi:hypothetical protein